MFQFLFLLIKQFIPFKMLKRYVTTQALYCEPVIIERPKFRHENVVVEAQINLQNSASLSDAI